MKKLIILLATIFIILKGSTSFGQNGTWGSGLQINATGTGKTTGEIGLLTLQNMTKETINTQIGPFYIPSEGKYQPYIVPHAAVITMAPGATVLLPLKGYCVDIHLPPVPIDAPLPPVKKWTVAMPIADGRLPGSASGWKKSKDSTLVIPGTSVSLAHSININKHPEQAAPILLEAINRIEAAYDSLKSKNLVNTPFSGQPEKEKEAIIQQTFWVFAAKLSGDQYQIRDFVKRTVAQYEAASGMPLASAPAETQEQLQSGVVDFWNTFQAVGVEAKVIAADKKEKALLCYTGKDCKAGTFLDSVTSEADCFKMGGKSVRDGGLFAPCQNIDPGKYK